VFRIRLRVISWLKNIAIFTINHWFEVTGLEVAYLVLRSLFLVFVLRMFLFKLRGLEVKQSLLLKAACICKSFKVTTGEGIYELLVIESFSGIQSCNFCTTLRARIIRWMRFINTRGRVGSAIINPRVFYCL
jgi:hypothetical protein